MQYPPHSQPGAGISTCAIVVTYNPDPRALLALVQQIAGQCDFLLMDNHSLDPEAFIPATLAHARCIGVSRLGSNIGLASAINAGLRKVRAAEYDLAVLFDQDSQVPDAFFAALQSAYLQARQLCGAPVAAIGPRIRNPRNNSQMPFKLVGRLFKRTDIRLPNSERLIRADFLISSGCLLVLAHLDQIGMMKDSYFIDNVDLEWCFRARSKGFVLLGTDHTHLLHSIGEQDDDALLVRMGIMVSHQPMRSYYTTRNRLHLWRQGYAPLAWKLRDMLRFVLKTGWLVLFARQRGAYWRNILRGLADSRGLE